MPELATYGADYFRSANYRDYAERGDRYQRTAAELAELLGKLNLASPASSIVDYGCAVGHLLAGFRDLGFGRLAGVEISAWARAEAEERGFRVYPWPVDGEPADVLVALDVFEHMHDEAIAEAIARLAPRVIVARIPSSTDGGQTFHLEVSRRDATHVNCKTKEGWIRFFNARGYVAMRLNLFTIYDTAGVTCLLGVRGAE